MIRFLTGGTSSGKDVGDGYADAGPRGMWVWSILNLLPLQIGDGTNFVLLFGGALLELAEELIRMGLSPSEIIEGYDLATKKTLNVLPSMYWTLISGGWIGSGDFVILFV